MEAAGRRNMYRCEQCRRVVFTVNRDEGVTPMFLMCGGVAVPDCDEIRRGVPRAKLVSAMYDLPGWAKERPADFEWYKPTWEELQEKGAGEDEIEHWRMGGLTLRAAPDP